MKLKNDKYKETLKYLNWCIGRKHGTVDEFCRVHELSKSVASLHLSGKRLMKIDSFFMYLDCLNLNLRVMPIDGSHAEALLYSGSPGGGYYD